MNKIMENQQYKITGWWGKEPIWRALTPEERLIKNGYTGTLIEAQLAIKLLGNKDLSKLI